MKKTLLAMLIMGVIILTIYGIVRGLEMDSYDVYSVESIQAKNEEFNFQLETAEKLIDTSYTSALASVGLAHDNAIATKERYHEKLEVSTSSYKIEKLFVKLGNHAASENVDLKIDVKNASTGTADRFNLNFSINGTYISITDYISAIENDSELGFKIENFYISALDQESNVLTATFVCQDIMIEDVNGLEMSNTGDIVVEDTGSN